VAKKNTSEVADHAADLPGGYCLATATQYFTGALISDHSQNFNKKRLK
jgi:hypothetical protein